MDPWWVVAVVVAVILAWVLGRPRRRSEPPGPWWCLPFVGHLPILRGDAAFQTLSDLTRRYGAVYRLQLGSIPVVVVSDPALIRDAFRRDVFCGRPPLYVTNGILEGHGLIAAQGQRWREQRRFVSRFLRDAVAVEVTVAAEADLFLEEVGREAGRPFDPHLMLRRALAHVSTALLFGRRFDDDDPRFVAELDLADRGSQLVDVVGALNFLPQLRFLPRFRRFVDALWECKRSHHRFLQDIVDGHRRDGNNMVDAFLQEMDRARPTFTEKQLLHLMSDMFGATLDTLKATLEWTLLHLALNRDVQEKVRAEMDAVLGRNRSPGFDDGPACVYTTAVVMEAQRLANVVPLGAPHGTTQDAVLSGYFVPKGTMVIPLLWAIHRDPAAWPDPDLFRPERFLADDGSAIRRRPDHFMPFCAGRRQCVGEELARNALFLFVARILRRFTLQLPVGESTPVLTPQPGFVAAPHSFRLLARPVPEY